MYCAVQAVIGRLKGSCKSVYVSIEMALGLSDRHTWLANLAIIACLQSVHQDSGLGGTVFYV
jgi:hypothetical protein